MKSKIAALGLAMLMAPAMVSAAARSATPPPETLTLRDLAHHPERLPDYVTMADTVKFGGGKVLRKGEKVHTLDFDGKTLRVTKAMTNFPLEPGDCDLLAAANAQWQQLTPAQRAVDAASLVKDASLWPAQVKLLVPVTIKGRAFPANTEFTLASVDKQGLHVYAPQNQGGITGVELSDTDLLARARELAKTPAGERPSRVVEELKGKLVDSDGKPATVDLDSAKIFAVYYGANWCPFCHEVSPALVKAMNEIGPRNPHLVFVMINDDDEPAQMLKYMKEAQMPWPALPKADAIKVGVLRSMMQIEPQLRLLDHYGNELLNIPGGGPQQKAADVQALMKLDQSGIAK